MRNLLFATAVAVSALSFGAPASAALVPIVPACSVNDVDPTALACAGFYQGNLLGGSPTQIADATAALLTLGLVYDGTYVEKIDDNGGSMTLDFSTLLTGVSYIGIHFGKGATDGVHDLSADGTAFYKINAGAGLDEILLAYSASSGATLFHTGDGFVPPGGGPIPEPATWAMMLIGFFGLGSALRSHRRTLKTA